jgi:transcription initiation factor TFIID subunit 2
LTSTNFNVREGNETQVRIAAFDGLMLLNNWYTPRVINYLLIVVAKDPSRTVRRHVARCMAESLAILFHVGDIKHPSKDDPLLIEEDGNVPDVVKESKKSEAELLVKSLRKGKDIGRNETLRHDIMPIML